MLKPTYKGFTLHIGTCALNCSPYTLAAHRYDGIGLEYKPKKGAFYGSLMLGNLKRATHIDTTLIIRNNWAASRQPSFKRLGVGILLGIRKKQDAAEVIIFIANDQLNSLPYSLDAQRIFPQANVASSLKHSMHLYKMSVQSGIKLHIKTHYFPTSTTALIQISLDDLQKMLQNAIKSGVNEALKSTQAVIPRTKISRQEVAAMLDVTPDYVYQLTSNKEIPSHKPGKAVIFYREEIEAYIASKKMV